MKNMKRTLSFAAVLALLATSGCYTSRRIAGDDLVGGPLNPYLWVTVPVDTVLSPYQIPHWMSDDTDSWKPLDVDAIRTEYHPTHFTDSAFSR
jgi:hypothetical protein